MERTQGPLYLDIFSFVHWKIMDISTSLIWIIILLNTAVVWHFEVMLGQTLNYFV
jgi:hypothetical protein